MKCVLVVTLFLYPVAAAAGQDHASVSPVSKVLQLLSTLEAKIKNHGEMELKAYQEYEAWCKDGAKDLGYEIKTAKADIEDLTATIGKATSDISASSSKIEELSSDTQKNTADLKAATSVRTAEEKEYVAAESELTEAIDTLDRAINILERKLRGSALVQSTVNAYDVDDLVRAINAVVDAASMSVRDKKQLIALAQNSADDGDTSAPAPDAYKSRSKSIIEVLEDMRAKAAQQLKEVQTQEMAAKHNFQMLKQSLEDQMTYDAKEMDEAKSTKANGQSVKATSEGELSMTKESLAKSEKTLRNMGSSCKTAVEDHDASVKSREEELQALAEAKKVLSQNVGAADSKVYSFIQTESHPAISTRTDLVNVEVVNVLRQLARNQKSTALSQLANRVSATVRFGTRTGEDPFVKVKAMIKEMLDRLAKEGEEEATHKSWCDEQMGETKQKNFGTQS
jgi:hypothetical protein